MSHFVEVAHLVNGELVSTKALSRQRSRREAAAAAGFVLAVFALAVGLATWVELGTHRVLYGPAYLTLWLGAGGLFAFRAARRASARAGRYVLGTSLDDDAYAPFPVELVQWRQGAVGLTLAPGMTGTLASTGAGGGRAEVALESLLGAGRRVSVPLAPGARALVVIGDSTTVVTVGERTVAPAPLERGFFARLLRPTLLAAQVSALVSFWLGVPVGAALGEADMRSSIPANATPWEVEKALRWQAQLQARSLHECFDVLPMQCQHAGYVGIGVSLEKSGEIRQSWIARSTFRGDCPVEHCMSDVVSRWFFEPVPESIRVILPVQVLRTERPLPPSVAAGAVSTVVP